MVNKRIRNKIKSQIQAEIETARWYKSARIATWQKNEALKFESDKAKLPTTLADAETRSRVSLHKMTGYIQTVLSKIDNNLIFKFMHVNPADYKRIKRVNALKEVDSERDNWDFKDLLGKEQGVFYGRAIYHYYADQDENEEYKPHLTNIDVYDFLIDPNAGGLDLENARYLGNYNLIYTKSELEAGMKSGRFLSEETQRIIDGEGGTASTIQEDIDKNNRYLKYRTFSDAAHNTSTDIYKFWRWNTTFEGVRYYAVYSEESGELIRLEKQKDMVPSGKWLYWSWACFPSLTEFWSQSYADIAREVLMAQGVSINQMMDNSDRINNPQRIINTTALVDENELIFKKKGYVRATGDVSGIMTEVETPALEAPLAVYEALENILQLNSGVTGASQGIADEEKVGIYQGNQQATADRFKLLNKSYSNGYKKFAQIYLEMLGEFLTSEVSVKMIGPKGVELSKIGPGDLETDGDIQVVVQASDIEANVDVEKNQAKIDFLNKYAGVAFVNPKAAFEIEGEIVGFDNDEIKRLTDIQNEQDMDVISECWRDIENLISGKKVKPNLIANIAYMKTLFNYMKDERENLSNEAFFALSSYFEAIKPIVIRNQVMTVETILGQEAQLAANGGVPNVIEEEELANNQPMP